MRKLVFVIMALFVVFSLLRAYSDSRAAGIQVPHSNPAVIGSR